MYLCLESLKEEDLAYVIVKLNEKFPPHSTDHKVRSFRNDFVKILSSMDKIRKFVAEKWRPYRDVAFKMLYADAHCVARQLPPTCFDQVSYNIGLYFNINSYFYLLSSNKFAYFSGRLEPDIMHCSFKP